MRRADRPSYNTAQLNRIATMAAKAAVQETFTTLGVDISTPDAIVKAQDLFRSMRGLQDDWKLFRNRLIVGVASLVCTTVGVLLFHFLQAPKPI